MGGELMQIHRNRFHDFKAFQAKTLPAGATKSNLKNLWHTSVEFTQIPTNKGVLGANGTYSLKPAHSELFASSSPPTTSPPKPSFWMKPILKVMAYWFTHPRVVEKIVGRTDKLLDVKLLKDFEPYAPMKFKSLDGTNLQGYWMKAKTPSTKTVILGHGYTADWREMIEVSKKLQDQGFNCFLFDFRAHGKSGGKMTSMGYHEGKDIAAAVHYVNYHFQKQSQSLFYFGHSMGAAAMMLAPESLKDFPKSLALLRSRLDAIVLDAPYYSFQESAEHFIKALSSRLTPQRVQTIAQGLEFITPKYLNIPSDFFKFKTGEIFAADALGQKPILLLHGDLDGTTPYSHGQRNYNALKKNNDAIKFITLSGQEHLN
ncbi:MAG: alpha/beta hydrolase, partial [Cyanobacteria bacterium]|nr:alpha/beta hydrolase [Cyanobacteriota bacterium]